MPLLRRICFCLVLLLGLRSALASDLSISSLAQQGRHHELAQELQAQLDKGESLSSFELLLLGGAYYEIRQYHKALATADLMEKNIAKGDRTYWGSDLSVTPEIFRAAVALDQGAYEDAIRHATEAFNHLKENQFAYRWQLIQISNHLGIANALLGRTDKARKSLDRIRGVNLSMSNLGPEKFIAMARIHMALKEFDKSLQNVMDENAKVSSALTLFYDPTFQNLPKFFIRAKSLFETGRTKEAKEAYEQLLKHPQIAQYGGIYWVALYDRARIALRENDAGAAIELLTKAVEVVEQQRSSIDSEAGRIGFVGDKQAVYQQLVALLLASGRYALAFEYVERSKARALVDLLASQKNFKAQAQNADADNTLRKLSAAESELVALAAPAEAAGPAGPAGAVRTRNLVVQYREQLHSQNPELASLVTVTSTPLKSVQALLQPDEALLEYYYTDDSAVAFVVDSRSIKAAKLERAGLEEDVSDFRKCIANPASGGCIDQAQKLYGRLIKPAGELSAAKKLVIVPHGVLHYLPFGALHSGASYLIDDHSIRTEPSASVLDLIKGRTGTAAGASLLLGNPALGNPAFDLKHAEEEATAIAKLVPEPKVLLREAATRSFVRKEGERFAVLHFATHGQFDLKEPLNSALLLSPDQESDGRLTVGDLYTLKLQANLVTLSACETALGKLANGDDVVGFTRGLLFAGASSIVSSLWSVDDLATRDLMVAFYSNLPLLGKQEALRQAQLTVKKQQAHPFFWAAFELTGKGD